jgi:hypothetical protein
MTTHLGPFYHGTKAELAPGDLIEPNKYPPTTPDPDIRGEKAGQPREHTYFSPRKNYISEHYGPNVYEIEPVGDYSRDPEYTSSRTMFPLPRSPSGGPSGQQGLGPAAPLSEPGDRIPVPSTSRRPRDRQRQGAQTGQPGTQAAGPPSDSTEGQMTTLQPPDSELRDCPATEIRCRTRLPQRPRPSHQPKRRPLRPDSAPGWRRSTSLRARCGNRRQTPALALTVLWAGRAHIRRRGCDMYLFGRVHELRDFPATGQAIRAADAGRATGAFPGRSR